MTYPFMENLCRHLRKIGGSKPYKLRMELSFDQCQFNYQRPYRCTDLLPWLLGWGLLALDLALNHPEEFRAVISLAGSLKIDGSTREIFELDHPQVNGEYKGRLMEGMTSPDSPKAYRKEVGFIYSGGWDPLFLGDLHYYIEEFDLTGDASRINTQKIAVHILSGEYDWSSPVESGRDAHKMIRGSTWSEMKGRSFPYD